MSDDELIQTATERYQQAQDGWSEIYEKSRDDLYFLSDEPNAQWSADLLKDRINRPIFTIDQLSQFVHQVENEERMNTPSIEIIPDDEMTDVKKAEVVQGIIRGIEYKSNADAAYDTAGSFAIRGGIGFIRVDHDYAKDEGFEQEFKINRVVNPLSCYIDPNSIQPDGSDAMWGFVLEDIPLKTFEKKYPKANPISFGEKEAKKDRQKDKVTVAEYFEKVEEYEEVGMTEDGEVQKVDKDGQYKSVRKQKKCVIKRYKLSGQDVLEETTFPGKYIPLVPVYGEEAWVEGKRNLLSLIRKAKSSQQIFNLGVSLDIEMLMKQPQASFMAGAGQISGFEHEYADPTKANVLHYNVEDVQGNKLPPPQRVNPPASPVGFINMSREAVDNIKSTLGMYSAAIGQRGNATSGKQEQIQQRESDVGNFHFPDNLVRSVTHVGQIIVSGLKKIYDTPRAVKMVDKEDNFKMIGINGHRVKDQEEDYDLTEGSFDVRVKTGPSFTTQREAAAQFGMELAQALPEMAPGFVDLVAKYKDGAGAAAYAARLKKMVDPKLLSDEEKDKELPDPQVVALTQQLEQAMAAMQAMQAELQSKRAETQIKMAEVGIKQEEVNVKKAEVGIKEQDLKLKYLTQLQQPTENKPEVKQEPVMPDDSIEVLQARIVQKITEQQQAEMDAEEEAAGELMELEVKAQQTEAVINALGGIQQTLAVVAQTNAANAEQTARLANVMQNPPQISFLRDEQGNITGAI